MTNLHEQLLALMTVNMEVSDDLVEALEGHRAATEDAIVARATVKDGRAAILIEHAATIEETLGSNEQIREARIAQLLDEERAAQFLAERAERRASTVLDIARARVDALDRELRAFEAIARLAPASATAAVRACRVCGCTESRACEGPMGEGCSWVEQDLCSACVAPVDQEAPPAVVADPPPVPPTPGALEAFGIPARLEAAGKRAVEFRPVAHPDGRASIDVFRVGGRGGEKRIGHLLGPAGDVATWQASHFYTADRPRPQDTATAPTWQGAAAYVVEHFKGIELVEPLVLAAAGAVVPARDEPAAPGVDPMPAPDFTRARTEEAIARVRAGDYELGDGGRLFAADWQRAATAMPIMRTTLGIESAAAATGIIAEVTGVPYASDAMVDTEALASAIAGYHRDRHDFLREPPAERQDLPAAIARFRALPAPELRPGLRVLVELETMDEPVLAGAHVLRGFEGSPKWQIELDDQPGPMMVNASQLRGFAADLLAGRIDPVEEALRQREQAPPVDDEFGAA